MAPPAARLSAAPPGACKCRAGPSSACGHASVPPFTCEEHRTFCLSPAARCPSRHMPASAMQPHFPPAAGHLRTICPWIPRGLAALLRPRICAAVHLRRTPRAFCLFPAAVHPFRHMPASAARPHFPPAAGHLRPHVPCEYHASSFLSCGASAPPFTRKEHHAFFARGASAPSCAACAACRTSFFSLSGKCSPGALGRQCRLRFVLYMSHIRAFCLRRGICAPMYPANITHLHFSPAVHLHHRSPAKNTTHFSPAVHLRRPAPPVRCAGRRSFPFPASARPAP